MSCADLRVVQTLPDIGINMLPTFSPNDNIDKVNVVSYNLNVIRFFFIQNSKINNIYNSVINHYNVI